MWVMIFKEKGEVVVEEESVVSYGKSSSHHNVILYKKCVHGVALLRRVEHDQSCFSLWPK